MNDELKASCLQFIVHRSAFIVKSMAERVRVIKRGAKAASGGRAVSPARRAAFEILRRVEEEGAFAAPLLANPPGALSAEDRALCYELVLGVLRRQLWLDRAVEHFAGRNV